MTAEKFSNYLNNPESITKEDYAQLKQLTEQYPYFQAAHILLLQNTRKFDKKSVNKQLEKSGVFVTNRTLLFLRMRKTVSADSPADKNTGTENSEKKPVIKVAPPSDQKQKLEEQLRQIEKKAKDPAETQDHSRKEDEKNLKPEEIDEKTAQDDVKTDKKEPVLKESEKELSKKEPKIIKETKNETPDKTDRPKEEPKEELSDSGKKTHNALLDDLFTQRVKKKEEEEKEAEEKKKSEIKKADDISPEKLTEDIYNKIAGLKSGRHSEKTFKETDGEKLLSENKSDEAADNLKETKTKKPADKTNQKTDSEEAVKTEKKEDEKKESVKPAEEKAKLEDIQIKSEAEDKEEKKEETLVKKEEKHEELSAADKLVSRIQSIKKNVKTGDSKKDSSLKTEEKQTEKKEDTRINEQDDIIFEVTESQKEEKTDSDNKTAADSILERINRLKNKESKNKDELIDKFVQTEPRLDRNKNPEIEGDVAEDSTKEKEPVVTELMANIYINQGYYDKAIDVFNKLILKNPEKKDYFAAKIQETEEMK